MTILEKIRELEERRAKVKRVIDNVARDKFDKKKNTLITTDDKEFGALGKEYARLESEYLQLVASLSLNELMDLANEA